MTGASSRARQQTLVLAALLTGLFMANMDSTIVNVAAPSIRDDLKASGAALEFVFGGFVLAYAVLLMTGARLGSLAGHRRVFLGGVAVFLAASIVCAVAPNVAVLIGARVAQGAGAAALVPQVLTTIQLQFEGTAKARALGRYVLALSGGAVAGQILGGVIVDADIAGTGWRAIFLINLPLGLAVLAAGAAALPRDASGSARTGKLDLRGVALLSTGVLLLVLPVDMGRTAGWPLWTWVSLATSIPVLTAFVRGQLGMAESGSRPLVNLRLLADRSIALALAGSSMVTSTYFALLFTLSLYLQQGLGRSALTSGLSLVTWVAAFGVAGRLVSGARPDAKAVLPAAGCSLLALAFASISGLNAADLTAEPPLIALLGLGGLGLGTAFSAIIAHVTTTVRPADAPDISGIITTSSQIAGLIGVATIGTLYLGLASRTTPTHAFALTTGVSAALAAAAVPITLSATRSIRSAGRTPSRDQRIGPEPAEESAA